MQARRAALGFLTVASPAVLLLFWLGGAVGELLFALVAAAFPIALIVLGVARRRGLGRLTAPLLALSVILAVALVAIWLLRGRVDELPWIGGLPLAAAIQLYGLWLVPLLLVTLAYALSFDSAGLSDAALERLRLGCGDPSDGGSPDCEPPDSEPPDGRLPGSEPAEGRPAGTEPEETGPPRREA